MAAAARTASNDSIRPGTRAMIRHGPSIETATPHWGWPTGRRVSIGRRHHARPPYTGKIPAINPDEMLRNRLVRSHRPRHAALRGTTANAPKHKSP
jgi:hypothetical protein